VCPSWIPLCKESKPKPVDPLTGCDETLPQNLELDSSAKHAVIIVHGWKGKPSDRDFVALEKAIKGTLKGKSGWTVALLDWSKAAGTTYSSEGLEFQAPHTVEARRVGLCLGARLKGMNLGSIHLISHSLGAWVIDVATDLMGP
jgi:hypothetical protein